MFCRHAAEDDVRTSVGLVVALAGSDSGGMEEVDRGAVADESGLPYQRWPNEFSNDCQQLDIQEGRTVMGMRGDWATATAEALGCEAL
jgi:hypothetical protein